MTWEEKFVAMQQLGECSLTMSRPGNWFVKQSVEVKQGGFLSFRWGTGNSPEEAVLDHWDKLTNLKPEEYLVVNPGNEKREAFVWTGFMWKRVNENINNVGESIPVTE